MTTAHLKSFLVSPWTILGSIIVGILSGVYAPEFSIGLDSIGSIYISLLKVVVSESDAKLKDFLALWGGEEFQ